MSIGGGGSNGNLRWTDLALNDLLPIDEEKEEAQRAIQARKMASGASNNQSQAQQAQTAQVPPENEEDEEGEDEDEDDNNEDEDDEEGMMEEGEEEDLSDGDEEPWALPERYIKRGQLCYAPDDREATTELPKSSCNRSVTLPSCSIAHPYASKSTVSVRGTKCEAKTRIILVTREIAVRVESSISYISNSASFVFGEMNDTYIVNVWVDGLSIEAFFSLLVLNFHMFAYPDVSIKTKDDIHSARQW